MTELEAEEIELAARMEKVQIRIKALKELDSTVLAAIASLDEAIKKVQALEPNNLEHYQALVDKLFSSGSTQTDVTTPLVAEPLVAETRPPLAGLTLPEIAPDVSTSKVSLPYAEMIFLQNNVGYLRKNETGEILSGYLGGKSKSLLGVWGKSICKAAASGTCKFLVRDAVRLTSYKYEVKFTGINFSQLKALCKINPMDSPTLPHPTANTGSVAPEVAPGNTTGVAASPTLLEESAPRAAAISPNEQRFCIGDRIQVISDRHGEDLLNKLGTVSVPSSVGAVVNVGGVLKFFHDDELKLLEASTPRNPADDLYAPPPVQAPSDGKEISL